MKGLESLIGSQPFTTGMTSEHIHKIAECASYLEIPGGRYVFRVGHPAEEFYLILEGVAEIELFSASGGPVVLQTIGKGSVLGWSWLLEPYLWRFDARVVEPLSAIRIDAIRLRNLMDQDVTLGFEVLKRFLKIMDDRLESERLRLLDLYASHS